MAPHTVFLVLALGLSAALADNMTRGVYEHYTEGGIKSGLRGEGENFYLNDKKLFLHSGALHYFRVHPGYWRDRLKKLRAAGLVAVETYVPWNLHNPQKGVFDFGKGGDDMSPFLDIQQFLKIAKEEDLLVLVRSGPYICAEWEFGGMPSWLLRDPQMKFRSSQGPYETVVKEYFDNLLPILREQQFTKGGPIIAFQIENEYGNTKEPNKDTDLAHLANLKKMMEDHGLVELFYTSDTPTVGQKYGALPGVLMTANFNSRVTAELTQLNAWQPDKPSMVMEYWSGWFDHWGEKHHTVDPKQFSSMLEEILDFPAHVNFYMFHGGTSFGFMNGANVNNGFPFYAPDISSYDYDAPLSEAGDYTPKYHSTKAILAAHQSVPISVPELPAETVKEQYEDLVSTQLLEWDNILSQVPDSAKQTLQFTNYMEMLDINNKSGQSYGYVAYRTHTHITPQTPTTPLSIRGQLKGVAMVVVDGKRQSKPLTKTDDLNGFGYWIANDSTIFLAVNPKGSTVDVIVENWGRNNFGKLYEFNETKGLAPGQILIDYQVQENWEVFSLEFKGKWINSLTGWSPVAPNATLDGPLLLNFNLNVKDEPKDTFIDMRGWGKGVVFVNGFNLGRFCTLGPARTLYVPAPLLKTGQNQIVVFEHFTVPKDDQGRVVLKFSKAPIWEPIQNPIRISFSS